ncbi:DNA gyrase subunit B [Streptomyces canus]|uniref:DNA gyrase subunit B n=1 Tax=Streptomyces canus TaxID=58343 RepID=UPI002254FDAE|nr:DNA gyrase subunit B [Streptomyces canus]MCX4853593.1 DNA gyrase subunit B [Streptomyces canus]
MEYDVAAIEVLEGRDAVRKRPGMWIGSVGERGVLQMVWEAVGRAVNQSLPGRGGTVDDGPGDPFEATGDTGGPGLETLLTSPHAGPDPGGRHAAAVGHPRVGLCVVNALSSRLRAEVRREGVLRAQEYARGVAVAPPATVGPAAGTGTTIAFWPDTEIFETTRYSFAVLAERFRQVAFLNPGLGITLTDERPAGKARAVMFRYPGGVRDFVGALDAEAGALVHQDAIGFERENPRMAGAMEVAFLWSGSREERIHSFANSLATRQGGTHVDGFRDGVAAAVTAYARRRGLLTPADPDPDVARIGVGLTAVVSVKLDRPEFLGATVGLLGNTAVRACVGEAVQEHLGTWFEERPERAAEIVARFVRGVHEE